MFVNIRESTLQSGRKVEWEVINLRFAGGLTIAESAKVMKKSEGAIKALQFSAIQALRRLLATGESG